MAWNDSLQNPQPVGSQCGPAVERGSTTTYVDADDITDICVDNIYVLGANKAGFSISTNDGAHVKDGQLLFEIDARDPDRVGDRGHAPRAA